MYGTESGDTILDNKLIIPSETQYYVLHIHFNYDPSRNQDYQQGKEFIGNIKVIMGEKTSDWVVSTEPNDTGGYTLEAFVGDIENSDSVEVVPNYYTSTNVAPLYYEFSGNSDYASMPNKNAYNVTIPNEVDGKNITELGDSLFMGINPNLGTVNEIYMRISEVTISEGIIKTNGFFNAIDSEGIGSFFLCFNLNNIILPSTLIEIGEFAFGITNLNSLTLPENLEVIGIGAFQDCGLNGTINIPNSVTSLGSNVFYHNTNLTGVTFNGTNLILIGDESFAECNITGSIDIPSSVTNLGLSAFYDNENMTGVIFNGNNLITIGAGAFRDCNIMGTLGIPSSVTAIGNLAFNGNHNLTGVTFNGNNLITIGNESFESCNITGTLNIPSSVTSIGSDAFSRNENLTLINFVGRSSTTGITLGTDWNRSDYITPTYATIQCSGTTCTS